MNAGGHRREGEEQVKALEGFGGAGEGKEGFGRAGKGKQGFGGAREGFGGRQRTRQGKEAGGGRRQQEQNTPCAKNLRRASPEGSAQFYLWGRWRQEMEAGGRSMWAQQEGGRKDNSRARRKEDCREGREESLKSDPVKNLNR